MDDHSWSVTCVVHSQVPLLKGTGGLPSTPQSVPGDLPVFAPEPQQRPPVSEMSSDIASTDSDLGADLGAVTSAPSLPPVMSPIIPTAYMPYDLAVGIASTQTSSAPPTVVDALAPQEALDVVTDIEPAPTPEDDSGLVGIVLDTPGLLSADDGISVNPLPEPPLPMGSFIGEEELDEHEIGVCGDGDMPGQTQQCMPSDDVAGNAETSRDNTSFVVTSPSDISAPDLPGLDHSIEEQQPRSWTPGELVAARPSKSSFGAPGKGSSPPRDRGTSVSGTRAADAPSISRSNGTPVILQPHVDAQHKEDSLPHESSNTVPEVVALQEQLSPSPLSSEQGLQDDDDDDVVNQVVAAHSAALDDVGAAASLDVSVPVEEATAIRDAPEGSGSVIGPPPGDEGSGGRELRVQRSVKTSGLGYTLVKSALVRGILLLLLTSTSCEIHSRLPLQVWEPDSTEQQQQQQREEELKLLEERLTSGRPSKDKQRAADRAAKALAKLSQGQNDAEEVAIEGASMSKQIARSSARVRMLSFGLTEKGPQPPSHSTRSLVEQDTSPGPPVAIRSSATTRAAAPSARKAKPSIPKSSSLDQQVISTAAGLADVHDLWTEA